ncbi:MAG: hypothetical protein NWE89_02915 [Candidatus Bathyarchaeota archaeon]|nr:hypothetical protein [Candidatus Bathyarchaeota archaeon]
MEDAKKNPLWLILVETAQNLPLYNAHKAYIRDTILPERPEVTAEELTHRLNMTLGEALVILSELKDENGD